MDFLTIRLVAALDERKLNCIESFHQKVLSLLKRLYEIMDLVDYPSDVIGPFTDPIVNFYLLQVLMLL